MEGAGHDRPDEAAAPSGQPAHQAEGHGDGPGLGRPSLRPSSDDTQLLRPSPVRVSEGEVPEGGESDKSQRGSLSHSDPESGFVHIDGDVGGSGYNETKVDIVAVPCPGADPVQPWLGDDPFPDDYFGTPLRNELQRHPTIAELAGDAILSPAINRHLPMASQVWVRQGIRKSVSTARVLLYKHRALSEGDDLASLAHDLLGHVRDLRERLHPSRPLFFIAHSIGGLVVKQALVEASREQEYRPILYNCHGVTFFGTPHRGSSYMSMPNMSDSIQNLLYLERPLPQSLADQLRLGNQSLLQLHDDFVDIASELRIWTVYETIDSQLSGSGAGTKGEVEFGAPLVSIKSSLVGVRQESVFSVDSDHANCASFGVANPRTMKSYLEKLSAAVTKAERLCDMYIHTPLRLKEHVRVELIGFYEDPDANMVSDMRLYSTKIHLDEFLHKGPERCLGERLNKVPSRMPSHPLPLPRRHVGNDGGSSSLGIWSNVQRMFNNGQSGSSTHSLEPSASPGIVVTGPSRRPSMADGGSSSMPASIMRRIHNLTVPALGTPDFNIPLVRESSDDTTSTMSESEATARGDVAGSGHRRMHSDPVTVTRESTASARGDSIAGFSRPVPSLRKFMWIHVPFTNPLWVKDIFNKLSETHDQSFARLFNNENWVSRHVQGRHSRSQPSFVKPACSFISADSTMSPQPSPSYSGRSSPRNSLNYLYLYLPYLHFDTYANMIRRRAIIKRRMNHGRARPVPKDIADLESLELRVIWQYLGFDPPLNCRRTLDQFGYPSLQDTYSRDDDQMLYKLTKKEPAQRLAKGLPKLNGRASTNLSFRPRTHRLSTIMSEVMNKEDSSSESSSGSESELDVAEEVKDGNVLMVDQLWLWAIDTTTLATFFPKRESSPKEGTLFQQADLRNSVYNELNGDLTGRTENALDLAAFTVLHAVTVLLDRSSHPDLELFRIFEEAIGMLTERMTSSLKQFRMQTFREIVGEPDLDDPEGNKPASIKKRYRRELQKAERENRENTSALLELRDMEDELTTLYRLFETQEVTIRSMKAIYMGVELNAVTQNGQAYLDQALSRLDEYKQQTTEMLKRVDTTRKDYEKLLEMAQRQAQVQDMRWSRIQTELASSQNLAVMIFTIFTVIFLPLSFFTGLFGMNTVEWDAQLPTLGFIGAISLPLSFFLIASSLIAAFSSHVQVWFRAGFRVVSGAARGTGAWATGLLPSGVADRQARRRKEEREQSELRERKKQDRSYDFWADVRRQRNSEYRIPPLNMKTLGETAVPTRPSWRTK